MNFTAPLSFVALTVDTYQIHFLGQWPVWLWWLLTASAIAAVAWTLYDLRRLRLAKALTLATLRCLVLAAALLILAEPAIESRREHREPNHIVLLIDRSDSMNLGEDGQANRAARAKNLLAQMQESFATLAQEHLVSTLPFAADIAPGSPLEHHGATTPWQQQTRIRESLQATQSLFGPLNLGAIFLLSDGDDHGIMGRRMDPEAGLHPRDLDFLREIGAPVHTVDLSANEQLRDQAIVHVHHEAFAFLRHKFSIDVEVENIGYPPGTGALVELWHNDQRLSSQQIRWQQRHERQVLRFATVPQRLGKEVFSVKLAPLHGEAIKENNHFHFVTHIIRDKTRVLHVCGRPSWDQRFLRQHLRNNPNVDLVAFFILRTAANLEVAHHDDLSLIPFPTEELFEKELPSFDLVILQNFNFSPYVPRAYLDNIANFVRNGGALAMIGGDLSFSDGGYYNTPLAEILPFDLLPPSSRGALVSTAPFSARLGTAGFRHPVTTLNPDPAHSRDLWESLDDLQGINLVGPNRPNAISLLGHPDIQGPDAQPAPVLAVTHAGQGRVLALTTDTTWFWAFHAHRSGTSPTLYATFWNQAVRWLIGDPELRLLRLEASLATAQPQQALQLHLEAFDSDYSPRAGATGLLHLYHRPFASAPDHPTPQPLQSWPITTGADGRFTATFTPSEEGIYRAEAVLTEGNHSLSDHDTFIVFARSKEHRLSPPSPLLRHIATATGGRYLVPPVDTSTLLDLPRHPPRLSAVTHHQLRRLWHQAWAMAAFISLLLLEWLLRRRWGLR